MGTLSLTIHKAGQRTHFVFTSSSVLLAEVVNWHFLYGVPGKNLFALYLEARKLSRAPTTLFKPQAMTFFTMKMTISTSMTFPISNQ